MSKMLMLDQLFDRKAFTAILPSYLHVITIYSRSTMKGDCAPGFRYKCEAYAVMLLHCRIAPALLHSEVKCKGTTRHTTTFSQARWQHDLNFSHQCNRFTFIFHALTSIQHCHSGQRFFILFINIPNRPACKSSAMLTCGHHATFNVFLPHLCGSRYQDG